MQLKTKIGILKIISCLLLAFGIILPYIGLGNWMIYRDEAYQILCCMNYTSAPMAMLTFYIGNLWQKIWGNEVINFRILMVICYQVSIALCCIYLYWKTKRFLLSSILFFMMCLGIGFACQTLYGWDAGAYPFMTMFTIALLVYAQSPSYIRIAIVGLTTAIMVLSRIPTLAALPLIFICIIYCRRDGDGKYQWTHIATDSMIGLSVFAIVSCITILVITSGDISTYINSWCADNIINGHFDKEFILWRWKDVSRRTIMGFYPMLFCFACSCYMSTVKKNYAINFIISILTSTILALFFIKTFILSGDYAAGIYIGLFAILISLPWLYNQSHSSIIKPPYFTILIILCCSLLAGIGSDGFLERPMAICSIPLTYAIIYTYYRKIIKNLTIFIILPIIIMSAYTAFYNAKNSTSNYSSIPHLKGIKADNKENFRHSEISILIDSLKKNDIPFSIIGTIRYEFDYVYNDSVTYNLNHFYYMDKEKDLDILKSLSNRYDHILLVKESEDKSLPNSQKLLTSRGYRIAKIGDYYELYEKFNSSTLP